MKKLEYLQTVQGQLNLKWTRLTNKRFLQFNHEPKSKNSISQIENLLFRDETVNQLKHLKKRSHRGDIILKMDFWVTTRNAPAIHTLAKNYLDLLHKELKEIDSYKELLFKNDNQIKILIVNYHIGTETDKGRIYIQTQSIGDFIKDLELVDKIDFEQEIFILMTLITVWKGCRH